MDYYVQVIVGPLRMAFQYLRVPLAKQCFESSMGLLNHCFVDNFDHPASQDVYKGLSGQCMIKYRTGKKQPCCVVFYGVIDAINLLALRAAVTPHFCR